MDGYPIGKIPGPKERAMSVQTAPLLPGAYHQICAALTSADPASIPDRFHARICTLSETSHLQHTPKSTSTDLLTPMVISPVSLTFPSDLPSAEPMSPAATPQPPITFSSIYDSSPNRDVARNDSQPRSTPMSISPRRSRPMDTFIPSRDASLSRSSQTSKNLQLYDMSTMIRSIDKWDPMAELPTPISADTSESPSPLSPLGFTRISDMPASRAFSSVRSIPSSALHLRTSESNLLPTSLRGSGASTPTPTSLNAGSAPISHTLSSSSASAASTLGGNMSAFAQSLFNYLPLPGAAISLHNNNSSAASLAFLDTQNITLLWQRICIRVLPVFVQEPNMTCVEILHENVDAFIRLLHERDGPQAHATLYAHFEKLLSTGLSGLTLQLQQNDGARLLIEFLRAWKHFYGKVIPYVHACFLPIETRLWSLDVLDSASKRRGKANNAHAASSFLSAAEVPERIDVRRTLLIMYRDQIVLPICDWLYMATMHMEYTTKMESDSSPVVGVRSQLMHLVDILNSLGTDDASQERIERLRRGLQSQPSLLSLHAAPSTSESRLSSAMQTSLSAQASPISPIPSYLMYNSTPNSPTLSIHT